MSHFNMIINQCFYLFQKCAIPYPQASYHGIWGFSKNLIPEKAKNRLVMPQFFFYPEFCLVFFSDLRVFFDGISMHANTS